MRLPKQIKIRNSTILVSAVDPEEARKEDYIGIYDAKIRSEEPTVNFIATQFVHVLDKNKELLGFIKRCLK